MSACVCILSSFSLIWLFETLWTVAHQAPLSMGFSRQEYWSGLPWPPPGDLPDPGMEPMSAGISYIAGRFFPLSHLGISGEWWVRWPYNAWQRQRGRKSVIIRLISALECQDWEFYLEILFLRDIDSFKYIVKRQARKKRKTRHLWSYSSVLYII